MIFLNVSRRDEVKIAKVYSDRIHQEIFTKSEPKQKEKDGKKFRNPRY